MARRGLYANIHAKRKSQKGRPTAKQFRRAAKTAKKR